MYFKTGIVAKIVFDSDNKKQVDFLKENFNLDLYHFENGSYCINEDVLKENFWSFYEEYLSFSGFKYDSIDDCCAYVLETDLSHLKKCDIILKNDCKCFSFLGFDYVFHMDCDSYMDIDIYFISIYWNINRVTSEDLSNIKLLCNNLCRSASKNVLKDASWFTII